MRHSTRLLPIRWPATPKIGESSVPTKRSDAYQVSISTDPVSTRMYQPRISDSISMAHDVARSAGHWKRKERTRKGASVAERSLIAARSARRMKGERGLRRMCLRTFEPANARLDAARRAGVGDQG